MRFIYNEMFGVKAKNQEEASDKVRKYLIEKAQEEFGKSLDIEKNIVFEALGKVAIELVYMGEVFKEATARIEKEDENLADLQGHDYVVMIDEE